MEEPHLSTVLLGENTTSTDGGGLRAYGTLMLTGTQLSATAQVVKVEVQILTWGSHYSRYRVHQ